jgi:tetratricopeptide (TPR) repeat protein
MLLHALRVSLPALLLFAGTGVAQEFYQRGAVEALVYRSGKDRVYLTLTKRDGVSPAERMAVGETLTLRGDQASSGRLTMQLRENEAELSGDEKTWPGLLGTYQRRSENDRLADAKARAEKADAELNRVYGEIRARLTAKRATDLRDLQREWIRFAYEPGAGAKGAPDASTAEYLQIRGDRAAERIHFLKEYAGTSPAADAQELRTQLDAAADAEAWPAVAEIARRILAGAPKDSAIWERRARAFAAAEDWERCATTLDEWTKAVTPPPPVIHALRGDVAMADDEPEEAMREWTIFIKATPKDFAVRDKLADALQKREQWADAAVIREQRVKAQPDAPAFARLAIARAVLRDWKRMSTDLRRGVQLDATDDFIKLTLPRAERLEKALPELKKLDAAVTGAALNPPLDRALFFAELRWPEIALVDARAALRRHPESRRARIQTAQLLAALHREEEAGELGVAAGWSASASGLRAIGRADAELENNGATVLWLARRADALNSVQQPALALEDATAALKLEPENDVALTAHGQALAMTGKEWDALPELRRATEINPRNAKAWHWIGEIESRHKNFAAAVEALSRLLELEPGEVSALTMREKSLRALGRRAEADVDAALVRLKTKPSQP